MAFQTSGVDTSTLTEITPPTIDLNITNWLTEVPARVNTLTEGWFGFISSFFVFIYLFLLLSDNTQFADFRYSNVRSIGISSGIVGVMGMVALSVGIFSNVYHIVLFLVIMMICTIWVYIEE